MSSTQTQGPRGIRTTRRPTVTSVIVWALQVGVGAFFLTTGGSKLLGAAEMVALFDDVGAGQWLRYLTGVLEVAGGALLLIPALATIGGAILVLVMAGATAAHLFAIGGSPAMPLGLLVASGAVAIARRSRAIASLVRGGPPSSWPSAMRRRAERDA